MSSKQPSVPSLGQVRISIMAYLRDMGHNPTNVVIISYENTGKDWAVIGEFQQGYLGDTFTFEARYDWQTDSLSKCKIIGKKS